MLPLENPPYYGCRQGATVLCKMCIRDSVEAVQPVKYQDVEAQWQGQSETAVVRRHQLPADPGADTAAVSYTHLTGGKSSALWR